MYLVSEINFDGQDEACVSRFLHFVRWILAHWKRKLLLDFSTRRLTVHKACFKFMQLHEMQSSAESAAVIWLGRWETAALTNTKTQPLHKLHPLHTWTRWQDCVKTVASFIVSLNTLILQLCSHETSLTQFLQPTLMHQYRERASITTKALNTHDKAKTSTHARRGKPTPVFHNGSLLSHKTYQCRKCTN